MSGTIVLLNDSLQFENAPLPFATNALSQKISLETVEIDYGKHQQGSIDNLNRLKANARKCNKKDYLLNKYSQYDGCSSVFRNCS